MQGPLGFYDLPELLFLFFGEKANAIIIFAAMGDTSLRAISRSICSKADANHLRRFLFGHSDRASVHLSPSAASTIQQVHAQQRNPSSGTWDTNLQNRDH